MFPKFYSTVVVSEVLLYLQHFIFSTYEKSYSVSQYSQGTNLHKWIQILHGLSHHSYKKYILNKSQFPFVPSLRTNAIVSILWTVGKEAFHVVVKVKMSQCLQKRFGSLCIVCNVYMYLYLTSFF